MIQELIFLYRITDDGATFHYMGIAKNISIHKEQKRKQRLQKHVYNRYFMKYFYCSTMRLRLLWLQSPLPQSNVQHSMDRSWMRVFYLPNIPSSHLWLQKKEHE